MLMLFLHSLFAAVFGLTQHCGQFLNLSSKRHSFNWIQSSVDSLNYLSSPGGGGGRRCDTDPHEITFNSFIKKTIK